MKSLFILGFFLATQALMAQTYTMANKTATVRTAITYTLDLKTGLAPVTTTSTTTTATAPTAEVLAPVSTTIAPTRDYSYTTFSEPTSTTLSAGTVWEEPLTDTYIAPTTTTTTTASTAPTAEVLAPVTSTTTTTRDPSYTTFSEPTSSTLSEGTTLDATATEPYIAPTRTTTISR